MEDAYVIAPPLGCRVVLHPPVDPFDDGYFHDLRVELHDDGLHAETSVRLEGPALRREDPPLVAFVQSLADDWQGWEGTREWASIESDLFVDARHDGRGHVAIGLTLKHPHGHDAAAWSARVVLSLEAGEELTRLAADLRAFLSGCRP